MLLLLMKLFPYGGKIKVLLKEIRRYFMVFYYIRHGFPTYHPDCLTPLGHRQAESVCRRLSQSNVFHCFGIPEGVRVGTSSGEDCS